MRAAIWIVLGAASAAFGFPWTLGSDQALGREGLFARRARARHGLQVELGRRLFFDPTVSRTGTVSCADCHDPEHGFSDARAVSLDERGPLPRHSQTVLNLTPGDFHWDGEFPDLASLLHARLATFEDASTARTQAVAAVREERRTKLRSLDPRTAFEARRGQGYYGDAQPSGSAPASISAATRLTGDARYAGIFERAFGERGRSITTKRLSEALAAYMRTLRSGVSAFDRYGSGDGDALSASARRGLELFHRKRLGCAQCHPVARGAQPAAAFFNTGIESGARVRTERDPLAAPSLPDPGRLAFTFKAEHQRAFKAPSLRDVARRAPYMHDGSLADLEAVVRYYDQGGTNGPALDRRVRPLNLSDQDVADLVAFLHALTSDERPGVGPVPRYRPDKQHVRILDVLGNPISGLAVRVQPFGDRLQGTERMPAPRIVWTDGEGWVEYELPLATHVTLHANGLHLGDGAPIPDWVARLTRVATDDDVPALRVRWTPRSSPPRVIAERREDPKTPGRWFTRVRRVEGGDWLYVAPPSPPLERADVLLVTPPQTPRRAGTGRHLGRVTLDVSGERKTRLVLPVRR